MKNSIDKTDEAPMDPLTISRKTNRRSWIRRTIGVSAAIAVAGGIYLKNRPTVKVAVIGAGSRGRELGYVCAWMKWGWPINVEIRHVVDPDRSRADAWAKRYAPKANVHQDYRPSLADKNVDAVLIATCDHWHAKIAIEAMESGKDVYCEKPMSITYDEGVQMLDTAKRTKSIFQLGTQQRHHSFFREFAELVLNDRLGEIELIEVLLDRNIYREESLRCDGLKPPDTLDWNQWLGPAPTFDFCPGLFIGGWHNLFDLSGGTVLSWGSHHWDFANWIMETMHGPNWFTSCSIKSDAEFVKSARLFDVPLKYQVSFEMKDRPRIIIASNDEKTGLRFTGTKGRAMVNRSGVFGKPYEDLKSTPLPTDKKVIDTSSASRFLKGAEGLHLDDFFRCVLNRGTPLSNIQSSFQSHVLLHLANIACRIQQPLDWNHQDHVFTNNEVANNMLKRT